MFPYLYYLTGLGLLAVLLRQCYPIVTVSGKSVWADTAFAGLVLAMLGFLRLPSLLYNIELNPDESQVLSQALTLTKDPVYGRSVDGTTFGPVHSYLLLLPHALGLPLDYTSARLVGLGLLMGSLGFFYAGLLRLVSRFVSRVSLLTVTLFFGWTTDPDFLHYSSELSSLVLITSCFWLTVRLLQTSALGRWAWFGLGVVAGLTPYCKLQTLPIVGTMLLVAVVYLFQTRRWRGWPWLLALTLGFVLPTGVVFGLAARFGVVSYFVDYYFVGTIITYTDLYAGHKYADRNFGIKLSRLLWTILKHTDFLVFIGLGGLLAVVGGLARMRRTAWRWPMPESVPGVGTLVGLTLTAAVWAVAMPGSELAHHLLLLVFPMGWLISFGLQVALNRLPDPQTRSRLLPLLTLFFLTGVGIANAQYPLLLGWYRLKGLTLAGRLTTLMLTTSPNVPYWLTAGNPYLFAFPNRTRLPVSPVSTVINKYATRNDRLAVWGWECSYHVESGLPQAASEGHVQYLVVPNRMHRMYLDRYADELRRNPPAVFVDAVCATCRFLNKPEQEYEYFPEIATLVQQNYTLVALVNGVRVYVAKSRLLARAQTSRR